jgi:hypothetical protein
VRRTKNEVRVEIALPVRAYAASTTGIGSLQVNQAARRKAAILKLVFALAIIIGSSWIANPEKSAYFAPLDLRNTFYPGNAN